MAEQKESSVLFSLKELMNLEEDRIRQEDDDRKAKAEAEVQARLESERRTREAEEARIQAEENRKRQEELRAREEAARLEAMRQAEVEKARVEAENAARMQAMQAHQEHERQLTAIKESHGKKKITYIAAAIGTLALIGLSIGGYALKKSADEKVAIETDTKIKLAESEAKLSKALSDLEAQNAQVKNLEGAVANAKTEGEREAAKKALLAAQEEQKRKASAVGQISAAKPNIGTGPAKPAPACTCLKGDPICADVPGCVRN